MFILEELLSPIVTPFILIFLLRNKSLEIIDFFRNFTVEVVGVGDICSFAQMDIRRHGNPLVSSGRLCCFTVHSFRMFTVLGKIYRVIITKAFVILHVEMRD